LICTHPDFGGADGFGLVWEGATGLPRSRAPPCTPPGNLPSERLVEIGAGDDGGTYQKSLAHRPRAGLHKGFVPRRRAMATNCWVTPRATARAI
jgi:hypothetical protein